MQNVSLKYLLLGFYYILQYNSVVDVRPLQVFDLNKQQQMSPV